IERSGIAVDSSLKAFAAGVQAASSPPAESVTHVVAQPRLGPVLTLLAARVQAEFPQGSHAVLLAGIQRLADYQDVAYATEYLDFLKPIAAIERQRGADDCPLLRETGRYLALWMSYEDAIRVADLKSRRTRFERVQREARVGSEQMLLINEFLYPRIEEFADIMPAALGGWMVRTGWVRRLADRMAGHGKVLNTTSILGFSQLYFLASLRRWRRKSLRFKREQERIAGWLSQVKETAANNYDLAVELAECPRLVKGYGDTHALGSRNFESLMDALPTLRKIPDGAARLKRLRELALADDTGKKLADALKELSL
ncbi:MAG TPA: DUF6537 domain-containing protein, partial [Candidatus Angelobacter sp.]|nr:DUF6537 domain-containing protein [Candidatus Angelobacter sp.]